MTIGCAMGACVLSTERGGPGCHLCDVTAKLPQPSFKAPRKLERKRKSSKSEFDVALAETD